MIPGGAAVGQVAIGELGPPPQAAAATFTGITFYVGGVDVSGSYMTQSFSSQADLGTRTTCRFMLNSHDNTLSVSCGQEVLVYDNSGKLVFAGSVDRVDEDWPAMDSTTLYKEIRIEAVDWHQIADRKLIVEAYAEGQFPGDIVEDIRASYLAVESITAGTIETGLFSLAPQRWHYHSVADALDELSDLIGYVWYIDPQKRLHFKSRRTCDYVVFGYTDSSLPLRSLRVSQSRENYRNRQYMRGGKDILENEKTETKQGDGEETVFEMSLEVAEAPTITVERGVGGGFGSAETVALREKDEDAQWFWEKGSARISQNSSETVLDTDDRVRIAYKGFIPILVQDDDVGEITDRIAVEGGTGVYEHLEEDERIESADLAIERAAAFLRRDGRIPKVLAIETDEAGLEMGCLQSISLTREGLSGDFLIQSLRQSDRGDGTIRFVYDCIEGDKRILWAEHLKALARQGYRFETREDEVLISIREQPETITLTESSSSDDQTSILLVDMTNWQDDTATVALVGKSRVGASWTLADGTKRSAGARVGTVYETLI